MNVLIFEESEAQALVAKQSGKHVLQPVPLSDGRYFLMDDVLNEPIYHDALHGIDYVLSDMSDIEHLLLSIDDE